MFLWPNEKGEEERILNQIRGFVQGPTMFFNVIMPYRPNTYVTKPSHFHRGNLQFFWAPSTTQANLWGHQLCVEWEDREKRVGNNWQWHWIVRWLQLKKSNGTFTSVFLMYVEIFYHSYDHVIKKGILRKFTCIKKNLLLIKKRKLRRISFYDFVKAYRTENIYTNKWTVIVDDDGNTMQVIIEKINNTPSLNNILCMYTYVLIHYHISQLILSRAAKRPYDVWITISLTRSMLTKKCTTTGSNYLFDG